MGSTVVRVCDGNTRWRARPTLAPTFFPPVLLLAIFSLGSVSGRSFCDPAYFWYPDGTRVTGGPDWSTPWFKMGPCLQVSGVGVTETYKKTVLVIDRSDSINSYLKFPEYPFHTAFAEELDFSRGARRVRHRPLDIITNTFCSSGQHVADGSFLSIGGDHTGGGYRRLIGPSSAEEQYNLTADGVVGGPSPRRSTARRQLAAGRGSFSVRKFQSCDNGRCDFSIVAQLEEPRWYPTTQLLGDGRVLVVGGSMVGTSINNNKVNVPSIEYYPKFRGEGSHYLQFLDRTLPFNLYPFVHLLPNGQVFIFAGKSCTLFDTSSNEEVGSKCPRLNSRVGAQDVQHVYPLAGTSAMFPLSFANGWRAEIIICGGAPTPAFRDLRVKADNRCWRIGPLDRRPTWQQENMRFARVMPLAVLLPDGKVLIHGGASYGYATLVPSGTRFPVLRPEIFDTKTGRWLAGDLGVSRIPRVYHSSGFLFHDGTVFFSGSNPNQGGIKSTLPGGQFATEFRSEFYVPPYFRGRRQIPRVLNGPQRVVTGSTFQVIFRPGARGDLQVVLVQPGFSTHNANHGMRNVELKVRSRRVVSGLDVALVEAPPNRNICPPTWYWLFILVNGVPNQEGWSVIVS